MSRSDVNVKTAENTKPSLKKIQAVLKRLSDKSQQNESQYCSTTKRLSGASDGGHLAITDFDKFSKTNDITMSPNVTDNPGKVTTTAVSKGLCFFNISFEFIRPYKMCNNKLNCVLNTQLLAIQEMRNQALTQSNVIQQLTKQMGALKSAMDCIQTNLDMFLKTQGVSKDMYAEYLEAHNLLKDQFEFPLKSNEFLYFDSVLGKNTTIRNAVVRMI